MTYVAVIDRSPGRAWGPWGPRWAGRTLRGGERKPGQSTLDVDTGQDSRCGQERL